MTALAPPVPVESTNTRGAEYPDRVTTSEEEDHDKDAHREIKRSGDKGLRQKSIG